MAAAAAAEVGGMAAASLKQRPTAGRRAGEEPSGGFGTVVRRLRRGVESRGAGNDHFLFHSVGAKTRKRRAR